MKRNTFWMFVVIALMMLSVACGAGGNAGTGTGGEGDTLGTPGAVDDGTGATGATDDVDLATGEAGGVAATATSATGNTDDEANATGNTGQGTDSSNTAGAAGGENAEGVTATATTMPTAEATAESGDAGSGTEGATVAGTATPLATTDAATSGEDQTGQDNQGAGSGQLDQESSTIFISGEWGFSFAVPNGWILKELALANTGQPADWPVMASWQVMPADVASAMGEQFFGSTGMAPLDQTPAGSDSSDNQDTTGTATSTPAAGGDTGGTDVQATGTPVAGDTGSGGALTDAQDTGDQSQGWVAPFLIEVVQGDEEALRRAYPFTDEQMGQESDFSGNMAMVVTMDPGYTHTIFQHPQREDLWIVLTDWVSQFPGRETQGETSTPFFRPIVDSFMFSAEAVQEGN